MFKIIAIETLLAPKERYLIGKGWPKEKMFEIDLRKARYNSVMKILHEGEFFWFVKGYEYDGGKMIKTAEALPDDFYSENGPYISFSAVVAENGMGKSSLLELLFRLINNVSYALREGLPVQKQVLHFVRDLYARVWVEDDEGIYYIEQTDSVIKICCQNGLNEGYVFDLDDQKAASITASKAKERLRSLFYTIVVNYSQHAYNTYDYIAEWDYAPVSDGNADSACWLNSLFHKNDSYQTPIVLNPYRESGNININTERELAQSRLFNLVLSKASPLTKILRNKDVRSFLFDINIDLNPIPGKRYYSKKVYLQMMQMHLLKSRVDYKTVNDIGRRITAAWGHVLGYEIEDRREGNTYWADMDDVRTVNYIVYKTLKISRTYAQYFQYHNCFGDTGKVLEYVSELNKDNSHITLKIRRCLAFLLFHHYSTGRMVNKKDAGNEVCISDFKKKIDYCIAHSNEYLNNQLQKHPTKYYYKGAIIPHDWEEDELMPAPSFNTDILLVAENDKQIRFSSLSSGEKQMIYSMAAVMYQLLNIESAWNGVDKTIVCYNNVCLVFDEIELYAHPKYQLLLVNLLVESIKSLKLTHIKNVDVILATHSPFVLSDIPNSNILCLEDGSPKAPEKEISSFCANVYDILNNQFFMDRFIGDFANKKLDHLIESVNAQEKDREELKREIDRVGDSYVKSLLLNKLRS